MTVLRDPEVLLVASFSSLMTFDPTRERWSLVHQGRGKYFGMVALDDDTIGVVSRPEGGLPDDLLVFDRETLALRRTIRLQSIDTHQIARDTQRLFIADTGHGRVLALRIDDLSAPPRVVVEYEVDDHLNSVRPAGPNLDVLLHRFGLSDLVRIDLATGRETLRVEGVGRNSHDLEPWRDRRLVCASADGGILSVDPPSGTVDTVWQDDSVFTKGLSVVGDLAYFGCSAPSTRAQRWSLPCSLVTVDVPTGREVGRVDVPHGGLVNAVARIGQLDAARR